MVYESGCKVRVWASGELMGVSGWVEGEDTD